MYFLLLMRHLILGRMKIPNLMLLVLKIKSDNDHMDWGCQLLYFCFSFVDRIRLPVQIFRLFMDPRMPLYRDGKF